MEREVWQQVDSLILFMAHLIDDSSDISGFSLASPGQRCAAVRLIVHSRQKF
jgi:hypothetical protein